MVHDRWCIIIDMSKENPQIPEGLVNISIPTHDHDYKHKTIVTSGVMWREDHPELQDDFAEEVYCFECNALLWILQSISGAFF